jgi:hypothetical protein
MSKITKWCTTRSVTELHADTVEFLDERQA